MEEKKGIGFFEKYLTVWVALCIGVGVVIGKLLPIIPETLSKFEYAHVSIPVAILISLTAHWSFFICLRIKWSKLPIINGNKK